MAKDSLGMFDQQRYKKITLNDKNGTRAGHLSPATTDGIANNAEAVLSFFHIPSESDVFFKAFITTFQESYTSDWNEEKVFGRTDGIYTFKNNTRRFTLAWKIPADTTGEAYENLAKVQRLAQFLYPTYAKLDEVRDVLSQSPLVRLKIMNLAQRTDGRGTWSSDHRTAANLFSSYTSTNDPSDGILGTINSLNINHNLENPAAGIVQMKQNTILPKLIEVSIDFTVIHEETLGWTADKDSVFMDGSFPYGARMAAEDKDVMKAQSYSEKIEARKAQERGRQQAEQNRANALARGYDGMFGGRARHKDVKRIAKTINRANAGKRVSDHRMRNFEYMVSAQTGYLASGQDAQERGERADEYIEGLDEFIE